MIDIGQKVKIKELANWDAFLIDDMRYLLVGNICYDIGGVGGIGAEVFQDVIYLGSARELSLNSLQGYDDASLSS